MKDNRRKLVPYLIWFIPVLFFAYQFIFRLWPGLMMEDIMQQFAINATSFGLLASVYYWGYAGMSIPIAVILDKYGTKYVLFSCATLCGLATILFSYTDNWYMAILSRFLIGMGSAGGFLITSKVITEWFPKNQYSSMVGFSFAIGLTGAVYGGRPVNSLVQESGFLKVAIILGIVSIAIGILALVFLKNNKNNQTKKIEAGFKLSDLLSVLSSPAICILAVANLLMVGSLEGFADVWGVNYLTTAFAIDRGQAAGITSFIFIGMIFGGPILALAGNYFGNYRVIIACGLGMVIACAIIFYLELEYNYYIFAGLFLLIGVLCCYQVLIFSVGNELVDVEYIGITIAFLNCINMLGGSFFHTIIGKLMDIFWVGSYKEDGVTRLYEVVNYNYALSIIPICALLGSLMVLYIERKYKTKPLNSL